MTTPASERYRLNQIVDAALIEWVHENCSDDKVTLPTAIWSRADHNGDFAIRPPEPFCVLSHGNIISGSLAPDYTYVSGDTFDLSYNIIFTLSVAYYDNRDDHAYLKSMIRLRQSLQQPSIQAKLGIAGISFIKEMSPIQDLTFYQSAGSQLKAQQDFQFSYIDVVRDENIGYIDRVKVSGEITPDNNIPVTYDEDITGE